MPDLVDIQKAILPSYALKDVVGGGKQLVRRGAFGRGSFAGRPFTPEAGGLKGWQVDQEKRALNAQRRAMKRGPAATSMTRGEHLYAGSQTRPRNWME